MFRRGSCEGEGMMDLSLARSGGATWSVRLV